MSVKNAINDLMPHEWYYVLKKNRVLTKFINYMYEFCIPPYWRNGTNYKKSIERIRFKFDRGILSCIDSINTPEGYHFWKKIESEIETYKEQIR